MNYRPSPAANDDLPDLPDLPGHIVMRLVAGLAFWSVVALGFLAAYAIKHLWS